MQGLPAPVSHLCTLHIPSLIQQDFEISPISTKYRNFPLFSSSLDFCFLLNLRFLLPPILTVLHLCIMFDTYWTPFIARTSNTHRYSFYVVGPTSCNNLFSDVHTCLARDYTYVF